MVRLINLWGTSGGDVVETTGANLVFKFSQLGTGNALSVDSAGTVPSLIVTQNALGGASVAPLRIVASTASQAILTIQGNTFSTASINVTQAQSAFIIPVYNEALGVFGYLSASKGVA